MSIFAQIDVIMKKENKVSLSSKQSPIPDSEINNNIKKGCESCHIYEAFLQEKEALKKEKEIYYKLNIELKKSHVRSLSRIDSLYLN